MVILENRNFININIMIIGNNVETIKQVGTNGQISLGKKYA